MSWSDAHSRSEALAAGAHQAARDGHSEESRRLFIEAAEAEQLALDQIGSDKPRTLGIIAISATALFYKGGDLTRAGQLAHKMSAEPALPPFAHQELRGLLQAIWNEQAQDESGIAFAPGQVVVSVKGGQVVTGGAPLDLIVSKVQDIQSIYYRTVEMLKGMPHRTKGPVAKEIQDRYKPWLFQTVPGSYQFIVAVQKPQQQELFPSGDPEPELLTETFLSIVKAGAGDALSMEHVVPDPTYRKTFLKLTQNLAPTGKTFDSIEFKGPSDASGVMLTSETRKKIRDHLRPSPETSAPSTEEVITGVLRAVHLEKDWLEVVRAEGHAVKVTNVGEVVDDVIGPMVNHQVKVTVRKAGRLKIKYEFIDIESDE
jgi:hypothetical protein